MNLTPMFLFHLVLNRSLEGGVTHCEVVREGHGSRSRHLAPGSRLEQESVEHLAQLGLLFLDFELELVELVSPGAGLVPG